MKHVPTPQQSLVAALAVLDELQVQWRAERDRERSVARERETRARAEELARRERIRTRAIALAERKRDAAARRRLAGLRSEQRELERMQARVQAEAAARLRETRREIDADLRANKAARAGRFAALSGFGLAALALVGNAVFAPLEPGSSMPESSVAVETTAIEAMRARLDAFAERQAMFADAELELLELRASIPGPSKEETLPETTPPAPKKAPKKRPKATKPKPANEPTKPATTRPPIVLEADGDPLAGIG